jgi:hypothetical protein
VLPLPTRPVLPPCGTTARRRALQCLNTAATCCVVRGRRRTRDAPLYLRIQSSLAAARFLSSVRTATFVSEPPSESGTAVHYEEAVRPRALGGGDREEEAEGEVDEKEEEEEEEEEEVEEGGGG